MKKLFSTFLFSILLILLTTTSIVACAKEKEIGNLQVDAKSSILVDFKSGEVLFKQDEDKKGPIASMCKIMTLLISFENIDKGKMSLDEEITISDNAASMGGSQVFLNAGDCYKVSELIKSVTVSSANDAAVALAERIAGSQENFVELMNKRALELGMKNTKFSNPTGLPKPDQYSTAKDVSIMTRELLKHENYYKYSNIWMDEITHKDGRKTEISNTNKLTRYFKGCDGGKTGFTNEAGHCLSCTASRQGMRLVSVIIGSSSSKNRFRDTSLLLNYGFNNYENKCIIDSTKPIKSDIKILGGKVDTIEGFAKENFYALAKKGEDLKDKFIVKENINEKIKAPIKKGDKLGTLYVTKNGIVQKEIDIVSNIDVDKNSIFDSFKKFIGGWKIWGNKT